MSRILGPWIDETIWLVCAGIVLQMYFNPKQTKLYRNPFTLITVAVCVIMAVIGIIDILSNSQ
jgi:predicted membrane protein